MYIVYKPVKLHYENMIYADISIYVPGAFSIKHIMLTKYKKKLQKKVFLWHRTIILVLLFWLFWHTCVYTDELTKAEFDLFWKSTLNFPVLVPMYAVQNNELDGHKEILRVVILIRPFLKSVEGVEWAKCCMT